MHNHCFASEAVQAALVKAKPIGLKAMQAVSIRGKRLPWWQLVSDIHMPPVDAASRGIVRDKGLQGCSECNRDRYAHVSEEPSQIVYRRSRLGPGSLPDVAETYERFGVSSFDITGYVAHGRMLTSTRVYDVLRTLKVRKIDLSPVQILVDSR